MDIFKEGDAKRFFKWGSWAVLLLTIFLAVQTLDAFKDLGSPRPNYNSISVTGEGEVVSVPDVATFSFSVSADAKGVTEAQKTVTDKMNDILDSLKDAGIEEKDIKTTDYSVWPKYSYSQSACVGGICPPGRQILDGYTASHNVTVKVRKTDDAGKMLALVGEKGATNISGITFSADDPEATLAEARALAIADARAKAKVLAKSLDVKLVRVVSYNDNTNQYPVPVYGMGGMERDMKVQSAAANPSIPQGENKLKVSVIVTYEIR